jgi:quercetin dioxygenase-like cupin family protein
VHVEWPDRLDTTEVAMSRALPLIILAALASFAPASAMEMQKIIPPDAVKWGPAPPVLPKGAQIAALFGDPTKKGPYIVRVKFPDGAQVPAHWHSQIENVTVISGTFHIGMGDKLDQTKADAIGPGGFFSMPAKMRHYGWAKGETVVQISGMGPFDIKFVDPKDDPSKAPKS